MNTQPKEVKYLTCKTCGATYGVSGTTPFRLAQTRPNTSGEGLCPLHRKKGGDE